MLGRRATLSCWAGEFASPDHELPSDTYFHRQDIDHYKLLFSLCRKRIRMSVVERCHEGVEEVSYA